MNKKIESNTFIFFLIATISLLIGAICSFALPEKYYNDADIISKDPYNQIGLFGGYEFSIFFYEYTFLNNLPYFFIALIQIPILFYILYKIGIPEKFKFLNLKNTIVYIGLLLIGVFICLPNKEFINFTYIALIVFLIKNKKYNIYTTVLISFLLFVIIGIFFRPYYFFIPIFSIGLFLYQMFNFRYKTLGFIIIGIVMSISISLVHGFVKGKYISESTREMHNNDRYGSLEAQSMIQSPVDADTWFGETIGVIYGYISVHLPINSLKFYYKPQVIAFMLWQILFFIILYSKLQVVLHQKKKDYYILWLYLFLFSYFLVQGLFEPDLGSAIRHKIGIFPLIYFAIYHDSFIKK